MTIRRVTALATVAAAMALGAPAAMANTPITGVNTSASCPADVQGGSTITCSWSVVNTNTTNERCSATFTFYESGVAQTPSTATFTLLANGGDASGTQSYRTASAPAHHGGAFVIRVTCVDRSGEIDVDRESFVVK